MHIKTKGTKHDGRFSKELKLLILDIDLKL